MDQQPAAPPVVAAVVTSDPGSWLEECLGALAAQDYPNLSVLVIDAGSADDLTPRVAAIMPAAYVRRVSRRGGYAGAANEVLSVVEGASHFLLCHDDVAPAPDAVRLMVEEAFRSNAGLVAPKLVRWDGPERLLMVGASIDRGGGLVPFAERGELDQEQHDAVRDVFVAPSGCVLVRADLFGTLGGYDAKMVVSGEDVDLSWRAQVAGARVVVAPAAIVRHAEVTRAGRRTLGGDLRAATPAEPMEPVEPTHTPAGEVARVRAVLKNYSAAHLARVLPELFLLTMVEAVALTVAGRPRRAQALLRPWLANLRRGTGIVAAHRASQKLRVVPDHEVRQLQVHGLARVRRAALIATRRRDEHGGDVAARAPAWPSMRLPLAVWVIVGGALLFGTRLMFGGPTPVYGEVSPLGSIGHLFAAYTAGWQPTGLGGRGPASPALAMLATAETLLFGSAGLAQRLLFLLPLPLGAVGVTRLARAWGPRARLVAAVLYVANPLPYNAIALGHWGGLIAIAALPWLALLLARASGLAPYGDGRTIARGALALGVVLAVAGAFVPLLLPVVLVMAVTFLIPAGDRPRRTARVIVTAVAGVAGALVLLFPWSTTVPTLVSPGANRLVPLARLLRFQTGPVGATPLGWALLATAVLPLIIGSAWRFAWAVRLWALAVASWGVVWAAGRGWIPAVVDTEVLLAPALLAVAACAGLGLASFEIDLRGHGFGWRQVVATVAAAGAMIAVLPVLGASLDGRWYSPVHGFDESLSWLPDRAGDGPFRVLWIGDPSVLPVPGWQLAPGVAYALTDGGLPDVTSAWPGPPSGATRVVAGDLRLAAGAQTTQLGHLLAPGGVRYIVAVFDNAPADAHPVVHSGRAAPVAAALADQVDLRAVQTDQSIALYENDAWAPGRAVVPVDLATAGAADARRAELAGSAAALPAGGGTSWRGAVVAGTAILTAEAPDPGWHLRVAGADQPRAAAFGMANMFQVNTSGDATLQFARPFTALLALVLQALLWIAAAAALLRGTRLWRRRHDAVRVQPEPVEVAA